MKITKKYILSLVKYLKDRNDFHPEGKNVLLVSRSTFNSLRGTGIKQFSRKHGLIIKMNNTHGWYNAYKIGNKKVQNAPSVITKDYTLTPGYLKPGVQ
jgi:hypothetical protein